MMFNTCMLLDSLKEMKECLELGISLDHESFDFYMWDALIRLRRQHFTYAESFRVIARYLDARQYRKDDVP